MVIILELKVEKEKDALWKQRHRVKNIVAFQIAKKNPERGLVLMNSEGKMQWKLWNVKNNEIKTIQGIPDETLFLYISPDGNKLYFHEDDVWPAVRD